ncbi:MULTISPECIES: hypothetical protein [Serratia]|uniref:Asp/Glu racemase n=1 Tax=Serratia plymuthica TaxID=82996 RepID=A0A318NXF7_SERPL|nr:hypothetical protein [Serratia plymuthica]AGO57479.1 hypothetical protein SOD_c45360 [Serratia plymuthica 4Rx13]PYD36965.1 hypothetical protein CT690_21110 [Serratia plymuthica]
MHIALLHTFETNIALFTQAASRLGLPADSLVHAVRADLRAAAEAGAPDLEQQVCAALETLGQAADVVVLTCSTLSGAARALAATSPVPILRADYVLAQRALQASDSIVALCATEASALYTQRLFEEAGKRAAQRVEARVVPDCGLQLQRGNTQAALRLTALAAEQASQQGATDVVLMHPWMEGALATIATDRVPLSSASVSLSAALNILRAASAD